jgi:hypothetical protein
MGGAGNGGNTDRPFVPSPETTQVRQDCGADQKACKMCGTKMYGLVSRRPKAADGTVKNLNNLDAQASQ